MNYTIIVGFFATSLVVSAMPNDYSDEQCLAYPEKWLDAVEKCLENVSIDTVKSIISHNKTTAIKDAKCFTLCWYTKSGEFVDGRFDPKAIEDYLKEYVGSHPLLEELIKIYVDAANAGNAEKGNDCDKTYVFHITRATPENKICDFELTTPNGLIVSPNYPHSYPLSISCTYRINAPRGRIVTLSVSDIDFGRNSSDGYDARLDIYDGWDETSPRIAALCGTEYFIPGRIFNSTTNVLFLKFESYESSEKDRGFHAIYTSNDLQCGGFFTEHNGHVKHPADGTVYKNNENCTWIIQAPPSQIVNITLSSFGTEVNRDYLVISEVYRGNVHKILQLNGTINELKSIVSRERVLILNFISDYSIVGSGFSGDYKFVDIYSELENDKKNSVIHDV